MCVYLETSFIVILYRRVGNIFCDVEGVEAYNGMQVMEYLMRFFAEIPQAGFDRVLQAVSLEPASTQVTDRVIRHLNNQEVALQLGRALGLLSTERAKITPLGEDFVRTWDSRDPTKH
ncbi:MAG: hypothetical protein COU33_00750 [Candidatus Magasanikbacteria bacterium CG10_big_fil_rev_8_21_14_0_10_43_6]|uniref:Uncharacterized protein n=1 Tax=Candidatus Magasanikbacteria bacterium CG10_big_fil_rev_8_21_14_0_10_43_6 TaxID=1974650 RepID=A0A2M6W267_9BACT|nr:MAG: hypothetical protein COU33_00750 [Candidatus Magasanikbacteria bacterium CG10_big_fil_rev_8_21_14_0_10_43_6]